MIATIRNQFQKSGKIVLWLIILSMAGGMILSMRSPKKSADALGTVNGYEISRSDFQNKVRQENEYLAMLRKQFGNDLESLIGNYGKPEERILNQLVTEKLLQSTADKLGMEVSSKYIMNKLGDQQFVMQALSGIVPQEAFYGKNGINMEAVMHYIKRKGISDEEFEEIVSRTVKNTVLSELIASTSYVSDAQLREAYIKQNISKKYGIATVTLETYINAAKKEKPSIATDELEVFYAKHSADYIVPETRNAKVWSFTTVDYNLPASEKEISEYYVKHKKDYIAQPEEMQVRVITIALPEKADANATAATERKAEDVLSKVKANPELFKKDGKVVTVARGGKNAQQIAAAFALEKDGDISNIIKTKNGFDILQRISRKDAIFKKQADVAIDIAEAVKKEKFSKQFNLDGQRIISQAADDVSYLQKFIADKKGQLEAVTGLLQDGNQKARKIFGLKENGRAFYTEGDKGYIVEVTQIAKAFLPKLKEVEAKVTADAYKAEGLDAMDKALHQALVKLNQGAALETIAKELHATYEKTDWIDPVKNEAYVSMEKKKIPVDRLKTLINKGSAVEELTDKNGYLIQVLDTSKFDEKDFESKKEQLINSINQEQMQAIFSAFVQQLKKGSAIELVKEVQRYYKP